jgi:hypothetical protein
MNTLPFKAACFFLLVFWALVCLTLGSIDALGILGVALFISASLLREHIMFSSGEWTQREVDEPDANDDDVYPV